jgi:hypothetical protein
MTKPSDLVQGTLDLLIRKITPGLISLIRTFLHRANTERGQPLLAGAT